MHGLTQDIRIDQKSVESRPSIVPCPSGPMVLLQIDIHVMIRDYAIWQLLGAAAELHHDSHIPNSLLKINIAIKPC